MLPRAPASSAGSTTARPSQKAGLGPGISVSPNVAALETLLRNGPLTVTPSAAASGPVRRQSTPTLNGLRDTDRAIEVIVDEGNRRSLALRRFLGPGPIASS